MHCFDVMTVTDTAGTSGAV